MGNLLNRNERPQNTRSLNEVINLGIPHVAEQIFESIDTPGLIKCLEVSETWRELAENVLIKRWKGKMLEACQNGETKVVQLLLERCNSEESGLNIKDKCGWTPFMWACSNGHKDVVQLLQAHSDIDLNVRDIYERTALMYACYSGHTDVVQMLLDHAKRIDMNAKDVYYQYTAFILACSEGHKDVVESLLDYSERIDLNARDNWGDTGFMIACEKGHKDIVKLLLNQSERIELNARDNCGLSAFMIASHHVIVHLIKRKLKS